jgi:predicted nucleic acid-binding protein
LVDILRLKKAALSFLDEIDELPICSEVTRVEIIQGLRPDEVERTEGVFDRLRWLDLDETVARHAGQLGRRWLPSHPGIGLPDLVVAATADMVGGQLATSNVRHFPMFPDLRAPY